VTTANTFQPVNFSTNALRDGWAHTAGTSNFTCNLSGIYSCSLWANCNTTAITNTCSIIATVAGVEVAGSQAMTEQPSTNIDRALGRSFLISITAGQVLQFQFTSSVGGGAMSLLPNEGNGTTRPSVSIQIIRIA
jgi:hypothetical protein